ncbi:sulfotransferase [Candidatus Scalindua japonica]|uniref:Sulfotransferase n=1 Tax=Candidatus Scalindua japonica TaxID=1284222 RepID=A0A286U489_9BACT|nr:sulfotransferase [Candidatus Scalindua japonica]GAX62968.1 sulfotransferase [Candidatus Scalindua japonica]
MDLTHSIIDKQFIFIIGSPKSGTSWLQMMVGAHPMVCTTVELTLFNNYTAPWIRAWDREASNIEKGRWYQGLPFLWTKDEFYDFLRAFLSRVYEKVVATNPQATHVLDKHPGYSMFVEDIYKLLPNAQFIHIIRDGRDVAMSMVAACREIGYGTSTIQGSAESWQNNVKAALNARQYGDHYLEVRYEDLLASGVKTLKTVFDFCGLPASNKEVSSIVEAHQFEKMKAKRQSADMRVKTNPAFYRKGKTDSWREDMRPIQKYVFDEVAGQCLCELGYAEDGWWAESLVQKFTLPLLAIITSRRNKQERVVRWIKVLLGTTICGYIKIMFSRNRRM